MSPESLTCGWPRRRSWYVISDVTNVKNRVGRSLRPKFLTKTDALVRVKPKDLIAAVVERVPRTVGVREGYPVVDDGRVVEAGNVIWCTGFGPDFGWIDLPIFDDDGHQRITAQGRRRRSRPLLRRCVPRLRLELIADRRRRAGRRAHREVGTCGDVGSGRRRHAPLTRTPEVSALSNTFRSLMRLS
ncbi:MAG: hypothetical protein ACRD0A_10390 [Acidimicrobiales bacterium]